MTYDVATLGKWHQDVQVTKDIRTSSLSEPYSGYEFSNLDYLTKSVKWIYGEDISDKSVLDIACNAGGNTWACQNIGTGIKSGFGFDLRPTWIDQANWLKANIDLYPTDHINFEVGSFELLDSKKRKKDTFDIALFNGILYHLADPYAALVKVSSITNETIIINTTYVASMSDQKPCFVLNRENTDNAAKPFLCGKGGVAWVPNDERVIFEILKDLGFVEFRVIFKSPMLYSGPNPGAFGRMCVAASKVKGLVVKPRIVIGITGSTGA